MESVEHSVIQQVQEAFNNWAKEGHGDKMEHGHWPTSGQIMENLALQEGHWFLDIGCGNGYTVGWASQFVGDSGKAIGLDLSPEMVALAAAKFGNPRAEFLAADVYDLPFENNRFDRIINVESIYYYPDIPKALCEIVRVLKPGGWLAVMVDYYRENRYSECWGELMPIPMTFLSEQDYLEQFKDAGLIQTRTERLLNSELPDSATFKPGWGYKTIEDAIDFRQHVGSLAIWGQKP
jgi:SAM-dependent methyltransferase